MDSVFQELKRAREAKRLSISDVSDATLINPGFLEAIEQGKTDILPQTYVRAFIREYASVVGLDPIEIMKHYDLALKGPATPAPDPAPTPAPATIPAPRPPKPAKVEAPARMPVEAPTAASIPEPGPSPGERAAASRFALPGILILTLAIIIWNLTRTSTPPEAKEIPFDRTGKDSSMAADSLARVRAASAQKDSLVLRATTTDSVWIQIIIDELPPREYLFRPNRKITWKAKDRFRITAGKPGAVDFTLNEKHLGTPGKGGAAARKVEFNRQTLQQK